MSQRWRSALALVALSLGATARAAAAGPDGTPPTESDDVFAEVEAGLSPNAAAGESERTAAAQAKPRARTSPTIPARAASASGVMNPELSVIANFAAAAFSDEHHLESGAHDPERTGFNLQALELSVRSVVDPYLRFDAHLAFGEEGVELEEAFATTLGLPGGLQARMGQFLSRFGRINATHPHAWNFVDQPFALGRIFGGDGNRGLGAEVSWLAPLPWYVEAVASLMNPGSPNTARSFASEDERAVRELGALLYVGALKQSFELADDWTLLFGTSGAFGPGAASGERAEVYGTDLFMKYRPITRASTTELTWQTELFYRRRHLALQTLTDVNGYTEVFLRFARRWGTAARYELGTPAYPTGPRVTDPLDPAWQATRFRVSANVTHWPSEFSRFRLQGSADMPGWRPRPVYAVFLAAEFVVGAHGAHTF
ncbi:MAG: zinc-regulated TonB-dependent outer membrane receptor [Polyangiaceae bacterium]|nr:zinc-regulated TonB-dependent outer membrane receptor [Polyangiaceae bacterium]